MVWWTKWSDEKTPHRSNKQLPNNYHFREGGLNFGQIKSEVSDNFLFSVGGAVLGSVSALSKDHNGKIWIREEAEQKMLPSSTINISLTKLTRINWNLPVNVSGFWVVTLNKSDRFYLSLTTVDLDLFRPLHRNIQQKTHIDLILVN